MEQKQEQGVVYIYALIDPDTKEIRYIGKARNPHTRYTNHLSPGDRSNALKYIWISKLAGDGKKPILALLEKIEDARSDEVELQYIRLYSARFSLLNKEAVEYAAYLAAKKEAFEIYLRRGKNNFNIKEKMIHVY